MDKSWNNDSDRYPFFANQNIKPGLSLLKKLERAKIRDLYGSIEDQEYEQRFQTNTNSKSSLQGKKWEWQADDGTWQAFEPEEQMKLERAVEMGQKTVPLVDSIHFMHMVDLVQMQLVNMKTGVGKKIRRTPKLLSFEPKSKGPTSKSIFPRHQVEGWNFSDSSGDEEAFDNNVHSNSGIDFLGSATLLPSVRAPNFSAWSRHRKDRERTMGGRIAEDLSLGTSRVGDVLGRDLHGAEVCREKKSCRKKTTEKSTRQYVAKPLAINTRVKVDEMVKLKKWLQKVGLEDYYDKFRRERVTLKEVHALDEQDLKKMGLAIGARKRFLESVKDRKVGKEPPNEYLCPITMTLMKEPVILSDGFTYEKSAIEKWLKEHDKSPMTNEVLESKVVTTNRQLKKLIDDFKQLEA